MSIPDVSIRAALPGDAEALAHLHVDVWEDAYLDLMPSSVFTERRAGLAARIEGWRRALTEGAARSLLAEHDGDLIGFASVGPPRDDDVPVEAELWALYARAAWWNRGVGHRLLVEAIGETASYVWVLARNDRAIGFYRRHGFAEDGATRVDDELHEFRMVRGSSSLPE